MPDHRRALIAAIGSALRRASPVEWCVSRTRRYSSGSPTAKASYSATYCAGAVRS